jgi:hypothetical protein
MMQQSKFEIPHWRGSSQGLAAVQKFDSANDWIGSDSGFLGRLGKSQLPLDEQTIYLERDMESDFQQLGGYVARHLRRAQGRLGSRGVTTAAL